MAAILNRRIRSRSIHNNQPFSGLPKAKIRDEGLYFEKNPLVHDSSSHPVYQLGKERSERQGRPLRQLAEEAVGQ
jgi:hypothetical protein